MNIIHIFGITILLMGGTDSLIEDVKTDKNIQQRILLRKLQNLQPEPVKPSTWNEVLADVLVNKIRIFSFKNQDKEDVAKEDTLSKDNNVLVDFVSSVFIVYKRIYDSFATEQSSSDIINSINPKSIENDKKVEIESEDIIKPTEAAYQIGPKSEVELVEPKYHGKIEEVTEKTAKNDDSIREVNDSSKSNKGDSETNAGDCGEGLIKNENGDCIKNNSRLIIAVPYQCPRGYRMDFLGNCRMIFHF